MSFNIRYGKASDGDNHWRLRKQLVTETIANFNPDIVGLQEAMSFQIRFLTSQLDGYHVHGTSRAPKDGEEEQCAILFRESRFKLIQSGHFWLSETPDTPGSKSWDSSLPRMVSWVELRDRQQEGESCFVFNTHFDHVGREARLQSAALLRSRIQDIAADSPVLLTGDFNCGEGSIPQRVIVYPTQHLKLSDAYRAVNPSTDADEESTSSHWRGNRSGRRIDWVFHSNHWQVQSATIDRTHFNGRYPSDHYPVTAVFTTSGKLPER